MRPWSEQSRWCVLRGCDGAEANRPPRSSTGSRVGLLFRRKRAGFHGFVELSERVEDAAASLDERAHELRPEIEIQAEEVLQHEDLAVATGAGANADRGNRAGRGDFRRQSRGDALEDDR